MIKAEFSEKAYELALYNEIAAPGASPWAPSAVAEATFGVDFAVFAEALSLWNTMGYNQPMLGVVPSHWRWRRFWRRLQVSDQLPAFRVNLFLQAKRPWSLARVPRVAAKMGMSGPVWRFGITKHQQNSLERIERNLGHRALVTYASPVFHELRDLHDTSSQMSVVGRSTFVRPHKLRRHDHWVYNQPGGVGVACSEPEIVEEPPFGAQLAAAKDRADLGETASQALAATATAILRQDEATFADPVLEILNERLDRWDDLVGWTDDSPLRSFSVVASFVELHELTWLVLV